VKAGWQRKLLGDVCVVDKAQGVHKQLPYVGLEHIESHTGRFIGSTAPAAVKSATFKFSAEHLLYGRLRPYLNKVMSPDFVGHCSTEIFPIKPNSDLSREFLQYWFLREATVSQIDATCTGARMPRANVTAILGFEFLLPPLPEQQRIVAILDQAFDAIATAKAHTEKNLQNARALFESDLESIFSQRGEGWVEKRLKQVGIPQTGSTPKTSEREYYGDFIPFIKPADFNTDGSLDYENDGLSKKGLLEARKVAAGSALMVCIGATIGKCGYCDRDITTNQQINSLTPFVGASSKFIYYQMRTKNFQRRVVFSSGQATLPIINKSKWSALTVALPPCPEEQERIGAKFDALCGETQRLESIYRQKLAALEALKKSLLHEAFSGRL
jgi:type I restriction enzyme, S subunit